MHAPPLYATMPASRPPGVALGNLRKHTRSGTTETNLKQTSKGREGAAQPSSDQIGPPLRREGKERERIEKKREERGCQRACVSRGEQAHFASLFSPSLSLNLWPHSQQIPQLQSSHHELPWSCIQRGSLIIVRDNCY